MNWLWIFFYIFIISIGNSEQKSTPESPNYIAAVVEYASRNVPDNSELTLLANTERYEDFIQRASQQNADIIVFPEDGLTSILLPDRDEIDPWTTIIPSPTANYVPCDQDSIAVSQALKTISCAARRNQIYVVLNIAEKYTCDDKSQENCNNQNDTLYYNSNVVLDRTGKIISRYRKTNLFLEPQFNVTKKPEYAMFETDFGVKFGTFICFDILFQEPSLTLTRKYQVTDIVYSTAWFSEIPFLTALQTQSGWSYAEDVNLIVSGYNRPKFGNGGSGIFLGRRGFGNVTMPSTEGDDMIIMEVPKIKRVLNKAPDMEHIHHEEKSRHHVHDELRRKREDNVNMITLDVDDVSVFKTVPFNDSITKQLCHNGFCCNFKVEVSHIDPLSFYRLAAFNGRRSYAGIIQAGTIACSIVLCQNNTIKSCGITTQQSETTFESIRVSARFEDYENKLIMPNTLSSPNLYPINDIEYDTHKHESHAHVTIFNKKPMTNVITFGLYCRDFLKDKKNTASSVAVSFSLISMLISAMFIFK